MHLTRKSSTTKLPIERKGTKYIARASSHISNSVPVVIAVRDMLKLAKTANEVRKMIQQKILKINGRVVEDYRQSILLFNLFEADKVYELTLLPTRKFVFVPAKNKSQRLCKVTGKTLLKGGAVQLNLHDGSNIVTKDKINTGDSVYLDLSGKIKDHISSDKGKEVFVISGKYAGNKSKILSMKDKIVEVEFNGNKTKIPMEVVILQ